MSKQVSRRALLVGLPVAGAAGIGAWSLRGSDAGAQGPFGRSLEELARGGQVAVPAGERRLVAPFRFAGQRLNLRGEGPNVSTIRFDPSREAVAIELNTSGTGGQYQSSIRDLGFISGNMVKKTAVRLVNVANVNLERIGIASGNWAGAGSIGIETAGRQMVRIRDCEIACDRPVVIGPNSIHPTLAADFFEIGSCELISTSDRAACLDVGDGVVLSNMSVRDTALVGGHSGFRFHDRSSRGASFHLEFDNVRTEQGRASEGWSFDLQSSAQAIQNILFRNVRCDNRRHGIRVRNGQRITLINVDIDQVGGKTALDIEFIPGTILTILGSFGQVGGTVRLVNARRVSGIDSDIGGSFGPVQLWVYDSGGG